MKKSKDFRISRSSTDGLDEADYFWALIEPVWPDSSVEDELEHILSASPGQRALYVVTLCIREIDNGGLYQFLYNSSGMYAAEVRKAFRLLGTDEHAAAFAKALKIFPNSRAPVDWGDRQEILESISKARLKTFFKPLEEELYNEYRIWPYFHKYVDMHPNEFFVNGSGEPG
jgi:hypothetical protein